MKKAIENAESIKISYAILFNLKSQTTVVHRTIKGSNGKPVIIYDT